MSPDALIKSDKSNLYNNYTKLHGTHVLQIIRKRTSKAQKRDFAYTLFLAFKNVKGLKIKRWDFRRSYKKLKTAVVSRPAKLFYRAGLLLIIELDVTLPSIVRIC